MMQIIKNILKIFYNNIKNTIINIQYYILYDIVKIDFLKQLFIIICKNICMVILLILIIILDIGIIKDQLSILLHNNN
jgi:hypothetical protein